MSKGNRFIKTLLVLVLVLSIGRVLLPQSAVLAQAPLGNLSWAPQYMYGTDDNIVYTHYPEAVSDGWEALPADTRETILGQLRRAEYRPTSLSTKYPGSYGALNRAHALSLTFDADGVHVLPAQHDGDDSVPAWDWALRLIGYGYCETVEAALPAKPTVSGNRVEYRRGDLSEWYLNDERGLEQGFILARPPVAEAGYALPLRIAMAIHTSLTPQLTDDGHTLLFYDAQGRVVLNYSELHAYDADGAHLPTRMVLADDVADTMEHTLYLMVDDRGAKYPITIDPLLAQVAKLTASDGAAGDIFGYSASINGDTVVVGAYYGGAGGVESGSAYVFERNHGGADNWGEVKELIASDAAANDAFGWSVSISGDTVVVGAWGNFDSGLRSGSAYVFGRNQGGADSWGEVKKLNASDAAAGDWFGCAVSISGDTLVVGADSDDGSKGSAYVFERNQGGADNWGQFKKMIASDGATGDRFGFAVSISGDTVVVGANKDDGNKGSAYVFGRDQGGVDSWGEVTKLTASDGAADDQFGDSVSISGDTVVVGATGDDDNGSWSGSAYVFERNLGGADNWGQVKKLTASDAAAGDYFSYSVSISGDTLVVSAPYDDVGKGSAYEFERNQGGADNWGQVAKLTASDGTDWDLFGWSVSISGDTLVVSAPYDDANGAYSGSAYTFGLTP